MKRPLLLILQLFLFVHLAQAQNGFKKFFKNSEIQFNLSPTNVFNFSYNNDYLDKAIENADFQNDPNHLADATPTNEIPINVQYGYYVDDFYYFDYYGYSSWRAFSTISLKIFKPIHYPKTKKKSFDVGFGLGLHPLGTYVPTDWWYGNDVTKYFVYNGLYDTVTITAYNQPDRTFVFPRYVKVTCPIEVQKALSIETSIQKSFTNRRYDVNMSANFSWFQSLAREVQLVSEYFDYNKIASSYYVQINDLYIYDINGVKMENRREPLSKYANLKIPTIYGFTASASVHMYYRMAQKTPIYLGIGAESGIRMSFSNKDFVNRIDFFAINFGVKYKFGK
ncbi:MAG: hypothetical protein H6607_06395 [Flavobacteriales bacterium]|nr:hypothetical protein [Flavobacteriales bacterium]